ncbi:hypothetical protein [Jannaschia ovalis]|uniref:Glycerol-3-phosphate dehydrogenase n=1 Tax=Jannaschia ovalis TaxID=3038773 RepID=A0ABY8LCS6_9RHOB|nr:hypothetical protein [Jannaschia sp. GRR-S6-38]WGH78931.1 hypothetical protein P8627_01325 [Jannaschia sp. GRR-S6-38]
MAQSHDIEDVLSSIRRLVASDPAEAALGGDDGPASDAADAEALVLGPTQRVTEPEDPFQMIRTLAQEERDSRDAGLFTDALPEEAAELTRDLEASPIEGWEARPATPDDAPADYAEDEDYQTEIAPVGEVTGLDARTAEPVGDPAPPRFVHGMAEDDDPVPEAPVDTTADEPAAVETAAAQDAAPEEDGSEDTDLSDLSDAMSGDEALRELIAEIVRQELAGELGERITRNVRKLVRRELRQMMNSEEFD